MITKKELPEWLNDLIFKEMGGFYNPDWKAAQDNLLSTEEENRRYLGTYFPRSFTESYCIFCNLFENKAYLNTVQEKDSLNILTFGCGTGGDLMGLLEAIAEKLPWIKNIDFTAFDGNFNAIEMLKHIVEHHLIQERFNIRRRDYSPFALNGRKDFDLCCQNLKQGFDLICSLKMVNELFRHDIIGPDPFRILLESIAPKLSPNGALLCLDVTNRVKGEFLPVLLSAGLRNFLVDHAEFNAIVPIPCRQYGQQCHGRCYPVTSFWGSIFGSETVTYCMVARSDMANTIMPIVPDARYILNDSNECCRCVTGQQNISVFDLNMI